MAAVAVGDGPVYPVLFRASAEGRLDPGTVAYWDAPEPVDGVVIVRGHRLGTPTDQIRFRSDQQKASPTYVLNPVVAYPDGRLIGLDLVEVNPTLDVRNQTAQLGTELALSALGKKIL